MIATVGKPIMFHGYANDYDRAIVGIQFSLDNGKNWTTYDTVGATNDKLVFWDLVYTPEAPGRYCMKVRSINDRGETTPIAGIIDFEVE